MFIFFYTDHLLSHILNETVTGKILEEYFICLTKVFAFYPFHYLCLHVQLFFFTVQYTRQCNRLYPSCRSNSSNWFTWTCAVIHYSSRGNDLVFVFVFFLPYFMSLINTLNTRPTHFASSDRSVRGS